MLDVKWLYLYDSGIALRIEKDRFQERWITWIWRLPEHLCTVLHMRYVILFCRIARREYTQDKVNISLVVKFKEQEHTLIARQR